MLLGFVWMAGNSILDLNQSICNGLNRLDIAMVVVAIQRGCLITGGVVALLIHPTPMVFMATIAAASVLGIAGSSVYLFRSLNCSLLDHVHVAEWRRILRVGFPNAVSGTLGAWYLRIGFVLLAWFASAAQVGEYSAAFRIFEAIYILPAAMMSMAVPHLAAARINGSEMFVSELRRIGFSMVALGGLTAFGLWAFSDFIVARLFGPTFRGAIPVLNTLAAVAFVVFLNYFVTHVMVVINRQKRHALNQALSLAAAIALSVYFVPTHYSLGAAFALLGTEFVLFFLTTTTLIHRWKEA
jgi:O-antigen/teichoic acid export membrane protein